MVSLWHACSGIRTESATLSFYGKVRMRQKNSSVTRQKGKSENGCCKKPKHAKFSIKQTFLTPWHAHVCVSGGKNYSFFGKFGVLCFLVTPVLRFALLTFYRLPILKYFTHRMIIYSKILYLALIKVL